MLFFNDEGTENGGLIFGGKRGPDGKVSGAVHLSFDQYEQDQVVSLDQEESPDGRRYAGLSFFDRPEGSLEPMLVEAPLLEKLPEAERERRVRELVGGSFAPRVFIGRNRERASTVNLRDGKGKTRLRLQVAADGAARIDFLDAEGNVTRSLLPTEIAQR